MDFYPGILKHSLLGQVKMRTMYIYQDNKYFLARKEWMAFTTPLFVSLISLAVLLSGCTQADAEYGFHVRDIQLSPGYQNILARYDQDISLSREAVRALENGVSLTILLDVELRDAVTLTLLADHRLKYQVRFLPLNQVYQLEGPQAGSIQSFPRLRHVLNELANINVNFSTGPLAPGPYEFRSRIRLDNADLPAPMHLPAMFSADWKHDSNWSTWPFKIGT